MKKRFYLYFLIIIILDQISKYFVIGKNVDIIPSFFKVLYTENYGGAFGIGTLNIIAIFSIVIIALILFYIIKNYKKIPNFLPYILVLAGSVSNLIDRIFRGYVIDFIKFNIFNFPCFNIADISITIGIFIFIILIITKKEVKVE